MKEKQFTVKIEISEHMTVDMKFNAVMTVQEIEALLHQVKGISRATALPLIPKVTQGLRKPRKYWTDEENDFLIKNYGKMSITEIARKLDRVDSLLHNKISILKQSGEIK